MTLLDYFAAQAMHSSIGSGRKLWYEKYKRLAERSYKIAHAMIEERKKYEAV